MNHVVRFNAIHPLDELGLELVFVSCRMRAAMAVRAKRYNVFRVIRPPVAHALDMVGLKVRFSVGAGKRCRLAIIFAKTFRSSKHVCAHMTATFVNGSFPWTARRGGLGGLVGELPELFECEAVKASVDAVRALKHFDDVLKRTQAKDNRIAHLLVGVWCPAPFVRFAHIFPEKLQLALGLFKKQQTLRGLAVLQEAQIAICHRLITIAAGTKVLKATIGHFTIFVAVSFAAFTSDCDDQLRCCRCDNSALWLSDKAVVNILSAVVSLSSFESPGQWWSPLRCNASLIAPLGCASVKRIGERPRLTGALS
ncbi:hypothetical protein OKW20_000880 [Ensifer sp. LBL]